MIDAESCVDRCGTNVTQYDNDANEKMCDGGGHFFTLLNGLFGGPSVYCHCHYGTVPCSSRTDAMLVKLLER